MPKITEEVRIAEDPIETLHRCGGYYMCPKDKDGKRLGPLVGYAGNYDAPDGTKKKFVGDVYYNFAKAEEYPHVYADFSARLAMMIRAVNKNLKLQEATVLMGAPMGGIIFAATLAIETQCRVIFCEKKITRLATADQGEESSLDFGRHEIRKGDQVMIVEDVCNNFSTTEKVIKILEAAGGSVVGIACIMNRSTQVAYEHPATKTIIPLHCLIHRPTRQYKQEDPEVAEDIAAGNLVVKPKNEWERLQSAMAVEM